MGKGDELKRAGKVVMESGQKLTWATILTDETVGSGLKAALQYYGP